MASTKEYRDFILEQLSEAPNITCRPMMGEFLLYSNNVLFGGIYDDRLLVKIVPEKRIIQNDRRDSVRRCEETDVFYGRCRQQREVSRNSEYDRKRTN